jgi:hypothetical protein
MGGIHDGSLSIFPMELKFRLELGKQVRKAAASYRHKTRVSLPIRHFLSPWLQNREGGSSGFECAGRQPPYPEAMALAYGGGGVMGRS